MCEVSRELTGSDHCLVVARVRKRINYLLEDTV
jgi:hypothetical protein